jgi:hypothetical protein
MDSAWWDRLVYRPCPRHRSGLLGDEEYDYDAPANVPQHMSWPPSQEAEEEVISMEEYMSPGLSEEKTVRLAMVQSELIELGQWEGLGV